MTLPDNFYVTIDNNPLVIYEKNELLFVGATEAYRGDNGVSAYVHVRYSANEPDSNDDMHAEPESGDGWIGIYSGTSATAPESYTAYEWARFLGPQGIQGAPGADGADGVGVPSGGTAGQVLIKSSGTDYDTEWGNLRLQFTNTSVAVTDFVSDTTYTDFPYRAAIVLTGVTATMTPEVVLGVTEAMSGNYAPVAECYSGGVYIYAVEVPEAAITIPTIMCWKAV